MRKINQKILDKYASEELASMLNTYLQDKYRGYYTHTIMLNKTELDSFIKRLEKSKDEGEVLNSGKNGKNIISYSYKEVFNQYYSFQYIADYKINIYFDKYFNKVTPFYLETKVSLNDFIDIFILIIYGEKISKKLDINIDEILENIFNGLIGKK